MNCLWPATSRLSCSKTRTIFQTCHRFDSLVARLVNRSIHPYSTYPFQFQNKASIILARRPSIWQGSGSYKFQHATRAFASQRVVTQFEQLPRDYSDEDGLSFRAKPLSHEETEAIFGKIIDANTANRILRILHGRRVAGTLSDPSIANTTIYEQTAWQTALLWLRKNVPVDEVLCAGLRAEQELAEMEAEIVSDAERMGLYKPNSEAEKRNLSQTDSKAKSVYGESGLDAIRKTKESELDEKEIALANRVKQVDEIRQNTGSLEKVSARYQVELPRPNENPKLKYYLERAKVLPNTPPEMNMFQRLWPSGLLILSFVAACYLFTQVYTPPKPSSRLWPDMPPSAATIIGLIILNSIVLGAWRMPPLFRVLNKYFITVPGYPRPLSLIGNIFSHQTLSHFAVNMVVLWFVGTRLHDEVGRANFLAIYLSCGALGSFASLTSWVIRNNFVSSSLGASGALSGMIACYLLLNGSEKITLFGVFPPENWPSISAMSFLGILIGLDILGLTRVNRIVTIDHWAHLGGYLSGIGAAELLKMKAKQRKAIEMERRKHMGLIDRIKEGRV